MDHSLEEEKRAKAYKLPDVVRDFVQNFNRCIQTGKVKDVHTMYEGSFNKLTDRFFKNSTWPPFDTVSPLVDGDETFMLLYKELYFRHIYSKLKPTLQQRLDSFANYCALFDCLLERETPLVIELPDQWLWDIVDEFIYQFQSFCQTRSKLKNKKPEDIQQLKDHPEVWSIVTVLKYLNLFVTKSGIVKRLKEEKDEGAFGDHTLYYNLGYFSLIGLLRVHCLVGDYHLALKVLEPIDVTKTRGALFTRVTACQITLFYYVGFTYLTLRRHSDAIRTFCRILAYISRTERHHTRSYQYEEIIKKNNQMYALLAIALSLAPQHIDDAVQTQLKDKYGDKIARIQRGDESAYEELFGFACPKFISPALPNYDDPQVFSQSIMRMHMKLFMHEMREQTLLPTIRSYLKLYSSIPIKKLADFLGCDEEKLRMSLLCVKYKTYQYSNEEGSGAETKLSSASDIDFYIEDDMIHVTNATVTKRYGKYFVNCIDKFQAISDTLAVGN